MDWFFFATSRQSETLFTNLIVNFNLQFDHVSCNIPRKRTSGLTVKQKVHTRKIKYKFLVRLYSELKTITVC
jgi:hypothetical protein